MNALDLILLGRQLTRIGAEVLRGGDTAVPGPMPAGRGLVLHDVFTHPDSSISDITARTGLPQSYVSESVARPRELSIVQTSADPADGRRMLVRVTSAHPRMVAAKGAAQVDAALARALGEAEGSAEVAGYLAALEDLAARLRPHSPGPALQQLDRARAELGRADGREPGRDGREPRRDGREPGRDGREPGRDGREPGRDGGGA